jgi:hypothetical protein
VKIERIVLCYPDMDRIIVDKREQLVKFDLSKISGADVRVVLSAEEFRALIEKSSL